MHGVVPPSQHSYTDYSYAEVIEEHNTAHEQTARLPQRSASDSPSPSSSTAHGRGRHSLFSFSAALPWTRTHGRYVYAVACTCVWFTCSISLTVYNKWLFSPSPHGAGFPFPITVTTIHMFSNAGMAWLGHFLRRCVGKKGFDFKSLMASPPSSVS